MKAAKSSGDLLFREPLQVQGGPTRADLVELKALKSPPQLCKDLMEKLCMCIYNLDYAPDWKNIKHFMGDLMQFLADLRNFDARKVSAKTKNQVLKYVNENGQDIQGAMKKSAALGSVATWLKNFATLYSQSVEQPPPQVQASPSQPQIQKREPSAPRQVQKPSPAKPAQQAPEPV